VGPDSSWAKSLYSRFLFSGSMAAPSVEGAGEGPGPGSFSTLDIGVYGGWLGGSSEGTRTSRKVEDEEGREGGELDHDSICFYYLTGYPPKRYSKKMIADPVTINRPPSAEIRNGASSPRGSVQPAVRRSPLFVSSESHPQVRIMND